MSLNLFSIRAFLFKHPVGPKKLLGPNKFWVQIFGVPKNLGSKEFGVSKSIAEVPKLDRVWQYVERSQIREEFIKKHKELCEI